MAVPPLAEMLNWVELPTVPPSTPTEPPHVSPTPMALPAVAVSVNCMMLCPPLCPPKATQPDPESQCQPVRSCHPSCDPRASYHRLGGHVNGDVRKPYRFWIHHLLSVDLLLATDAGRSKGGGFGEGREPALEQPDQLRPCLKNTRVQFGISASQPGGIKLVVILNTER